MDQLLFSFLCIVRQKIIRSDPKIFENLHLLQKIGLNGGISIYADFGPPKGQWISKKNYEVIVSPKKRTKYSKDFCPECYFLRFLGEKMT